MKITEEWLIDNIDYDYIIECVKNTGLLDKDHRDCIGYLLSKESRLEATYANTLITRIMNERQCARYVLYAVEKMLHVFTESTPTVDAIKRKTDVIKFSIKKHGDILPYAITRIIKAYFGNPNSKIRKEATEFAIFIPFIYTQMAKPPDQRKLTAINIVSFAAHTICGTDHFHHFASAVASETARLLSREPLDANEMETIEEHFHEHLSDIIQYGLEIIDSHEASKKTIWKKTIWKI